MCYQDFSENRLYGKPKGVYIQNGKKFVVK